jgi:CheY-like chemotaxis protein
MNDRHAELTILLVEDDDVAAEAVVRSLGKAQLMFPVVWAEHGEQALNALRGLDPRRPVPRPRVTLLDLNMPRMNGFEFLQHLRADPELCDDVVFVLTTSDADTDRIRAYHEHIAGYMVKAAVGPQFSRLAQLLELYHRAIRLP